MGQQNKVNLGRIDRDILVFKDILTLLHAAVDEAVFAADLDHRAAAGDFMGRAQEGQLHGISSFVR